MVYWFKIVCGKDVSYVQESGTLRDCYDRVHKFNPSSVVYVIDKPPEIVAKEVEKYSVSRSRFYSFDKYVGPKRSKGW